MKRLSRKNLVSAFAIMLIALAVVVGKIHTEAAEAMQDGLEITLTTDKKEYKSGEKIEVNLEIRNNSEKDFKNVLIEGELPENYVADEGYDLQKVLDVIAAGGASSFETRYARGESEVTPTPAPTPEVTPTPEETPTPEKTPTPAPEETPIPTPVPEVTQTPTSAPEENNPAQTDSPVMGETQKTDGSSDNGATTGEVSTKYGTQKSPKTGPEAEQDSAQNEEGSQKGWQTGIAFLVICLLVISAIAVVVIREKKAREILGIFLCVSMTFSLISGDVINARAAAEEPAGQTTLTTSKTSATPEDPAGTETPADPGTSGTPATPKDPTAPETTGTPATPEDPADPGTPEPPATPKDPVDPGTTGTPAAPKDPADPGTSETPVAPADPETSEIPAVSEDPADSETTEPPTATQDPAATEPPASTESGTVSEGSEDITGTLPDLKGETTDEIPADGQEDEDTQNVGHEAAHGERAVQTVRRTCTVVETVTIDGKTQEIVFKITYDLEKEEETCYITVEGFEATDSATTENDLFELKGTVVSDLPITEIICTISSETNPQEREVAVSGTEEWTASCALDEGKNYITITAYNGDAVAAEKKLMIERKKEEVRELILADNVKVIDPASDIEEIEQIYDGILGMWSDDKGTEDISDDELNLAVYNENPLYQRIAGGEIRPNDVIYIPSNEYFLTGMTVIYLYTDDACDSSITGYDADSCQVIHTAGAGFADLFAEGQDISIAAKGLDPEEPIAFVYYPYIDETLQGDAVAGIALYGAEGPEAKKEDIVEGRKFQYQNLTPDKIKVEGPELVPHTDEETGESDDYWNMKVTLDDIIIFDLDGKKETEHDRLTLKGSVALNEIRPLLGVDWENKFKKPDQVIAKVEYVQEKSMTLSWEGEGTLDELLKDAKVGFENEKTFFWLFDVAGIDTSGKIYLCSIGLNLLTMSPVIIEDLGEQEEPVIVLNIFLDLEGELKAEASISYTSTTYYKKGFNYQRKGYESEKDFGTVEQNSKDADSSEEWGEHVLQIYNVEGKSREEPKKDPIWKLKGEIKGNATLGAGMGAEIGAVAYGIMPGAVGGKIAVKNTLNGEGTATLSNYGEAGDTPIFIGSGEKKVYLSYDGKLQLASRLYLQAEGAVRLAVDGEEWVAWKSNWPPVTLLQAGISTIKLEGTVYDRGTGEPISGASVNLRKSKSTGSEVLGTAYGPVNTDEAGHFVIENILDFDEDTFTLTIFKEGYGVYVNRGITFGEDAKNPENIYLSEMQPSMCPHEGSGTLVSRNDGNTWGAITEEGKLYEWGQMVTSESVYATDNPQEITFYDEDGNADPEKKVKAVAFGAYCGAVTEDGSLYVWNDGQPKRMELPDNEMAVAVSMVSTYGGAVTENGNLYIWDSYDGTGPTKILEDVKTITMGDYGNAAVKKDGSLWMWGNNNHGQLGDGTTQNRTNPVKIMDQVAYVTFSKGNDENWAAITEDGSLYMWGANVGTETGDFKQTKDQLTPVKIEGLENVAFVSLGSNIGAAVTNAGGLYIWGRIGDTLWENGGNRYVAEPVLVMDNVITCSAGEDHIGAVTSDGSLWIWGRNEEGQVGDGTTETRKEPVKVEALDNVIYVLLNGNYSEAVTSDGTLWGWGQSWHIAPGNQGDKVTQPKKLLENVKIAQ